MQANGIALPDENGAILTMSSIEQDSWLGEALDARPNNLVFADLNRGAFMIQSLTPDTQVLKVIANADPKFNYIPMAMINFGMRKVCSVFLNMVESKARDLTDEYKQLIAEKADFYDEIRAKCASTLGNNRGPAL